MKRIATVATAGAAAMSVLTAGCTAGTENASTATSESPTAVTLHQYIVDNEIAEVRFKPGEPGTPTIEFPFPPGWSNARERTPDWAYGAIVYDSPRNPDNPPYMVAIASKLTGDVDPAKVLDYAPGQLNELSGFAPLYEPKPDSVSGFQAVNYAGTYVRQGQPRVIGQQTIVVPGQDVLFVLQLNADAPRGEEQPVLDAVNLIDEKTVITLPS